MACNMGYWRVLGVALTSSVGALLFGLDMGYIGPILNDEAFKRDVAHMENWNDPEESIRGFESGFIVGAFAIGCIVMSFPMISSVFLDRLGRKVSIMMGSLIFIAGAGIQAIAQSSAVFIAGRFVAGCSIGVLSTVVPLYQAEIAPPELRGSLSSLFQVMIIVGVVVAALLDQVLLPTGSNGWRVAVWLQAVPALLLFIGMVPQPRSPRWLVQQGRVEEAERALRKCLPEEAARAELKEIAEGFEGEQRMGPLRWGEVLTGRGGSLLAIGMAMQLLQQLQGINMVIYFGPRIFNAIDLLDANTCQTITNFVLLLGTLPAPLLIDRFGRRKLLACSAFFQLLPLQVIAVAGMASMRQDGDRWHCTNRAAGWAIAIAVLAFVFNFGYGWGPTVWVYCGEMFPLRIRSRCVGLTTMSNWIGVYIVSQLSPPLLDKLGFGTFFLFSAFSTAAFLFALWLPETKGVALERIDCLFDEKLSSKGRTRTEGSADCSTTVSDDSGSNISESA